MAIGASRKGLLACAGRNILGLFELWCWWGGACRCCRGCGRSRRGFARRVLLLGCWSGGLGGLLRGLLRWLLRGLLRGLQFRQLRFRRLRLGHLRLWCSLRDWRG